MNTHFRIHGLPPMALRLSKRRHGVESVKYQDTGVEIHLAQGEVRRLPSHRRTCLHCTQGRVWVTQQGDSQDYLMVAGDQLSFNGKGSIVVQALLESRLFVSCRKGQR